MAAIFDFDSLLSQYQSHERQLTVFKNIRWQLYLVQSAIDNNGVISFIHDVAEWLRICWCLNHESVENKSI